MYIAPFLTRIEEIRVLAVTNEVSGMLGSLQHILGQPVHQNCCPLARTEKVQILRIEAGVVKLHHR